MKEKDITDGIASGVAGGFLYGALRLTRRLPKKRTRLIAYLSTAAVTFILTIATPHAVVHHTVATNPTLVLVVEYVFHLSITGAVSILAFYQHRFLVLSLNGRMAMMMKFKDAKMEETVTTLNTESSEMKSVSSKEPNNSGVSV